VVGHLGTAVAEGLPATLAVAVGLPASLAVAADPVTLAAAVGLPVTLAAFQGVGVKYFEAVVELVEPYYHRVDLA